ncbi:MAG: hypothetical protein ACXWAT_00395 [Methylobacter sp.]
MNEVNLNDYVKRGEVPTDPAVLDQLLNSWGKNPEAEQDVKEPEKAPEPSASSSVAEESNVDAEANAEAEKEPDGIATKDGKHIISYDVLKSERQARQDAQRKAQELEQEIERLKSGAINVSGEAVTLLTPEQMEDLKEIVPDQYEAIVAQQNELRALMQQNAQFKQEQQRIEAERQNQVALSVQEAIDNNPVLSHWQQNNPEAWNYCVALDKLEQQDPANANLSFEERFANVAKMALAKFPNPFPEQSSKTEQAKEAAPQNKQEPAKQQPEKPPIASLSELKGGDPAEASLKERVQDLTPAQINAQLAGMSPKQIDEFLTKLALNAQ